jgi:hypothetical protein
MLREMRKTAQTGFVGAPFGIERHKHNGHNSV